MYVLREIGRVGGKREREKEREREREETIERCLFWEEYIIGDRERRQLSMGKEVPALISDSNELGIHANKNLKDSINK